MMQLEGHVAKVGSALEINLIIKLFLTWLPMTKSQKHSCILKVYILVTLYSIHETIVPTKSLFQAASV